ncbi:hypothetical protein AB6A40_000173 [Gnathostoma spinigerum]|uniref:Uncharacterized protein n=1 Tax=Gnathostoma spinigerum TaxID=75299 RepID=A0ABD6E5U3_9BILA
MIVNAMFSAQFSMSNKILLLYMIDIVRYLIFCHLFTVPLVVILCKRRENQDEPVDAPKVENSARLSLKEGVKSEAMSEPLGKTQAKSVKLNRSMSPSTVNDMELSHTQRTQSRRRLQMGMLRNEKMTMKDYTKKKDTAQSFSADVTQVSSLSPEMNQQCGTSANMVWQKKLEDTTMAIDGATALTATGKVEESFKLHPQESNQPRTSQVTSKRGEVLQNEMHNICEPSTTTGQTSVQPDGVTCSAMTCSATESTPDIRESYLLERTQSEKNVSGPGG